MRNATCFTGLIATMLFAAPVLAGSSKSLVFLEHGVTENRSTTPDGMLAADIPLVSPKKGKRVGDVHFEVTENLAPRTEIGFGFDAELTYQLENGDITVDSAPLWCNLLNSEEAPDVEFPLPDGAFVIVLVCHGEGEISGGTGKYAGASGTVTRRLHLFEGIGVEASQSYKGISLIELDDDDDDDAEDDD